MLQRTHFILMRKYNCIITKTFFKNRHLLFFLPYATVGLTASIALLICKSLWKKKSLL